MKKTYLPLVCLFLSLNINAQKVTADKIVAVVGDQIILHSDIDNEVRDMQRRGDIEKIEGVACKVLERSIIAKLLLLQAGKDSISIDEERLTADFNDKLSIYLNQTELSPAAVDELKKSLYNEYHESAVIKAMEENIISGVRVTPAEVRAYFASIPTSELPAFDPLYEVCELVYYPSPSKETEQFAIDELNHYRNKIQAGELDFKTLMGTLEYPGPADERFRSFEINRFDKYWDADFIAAAFKLKTGEICAPVKTKFGYHLIQMVLRDGDNAVVRHVLRVPSISQEELKQATFQMDSLHTQLQLKKLDFKTAGNLYKGSTKKDINVACLTNKDGGTFVIMDEMNKDMVSTVNGMKPGDISKPVNFINEFGKKGVRMVYLQAKQDAHRANITTDYEKIAQMTLQAKQQKVIDKWVSSHLTAFDIKMDIDATADCPSLKKFVLAR